MLQNARSTKVRVLEGVAAGRPLRLKSASSVRQLICPDAQGFVRVSWSVGWALDLRPTKWADLGVSPLRAAAEKRYTRGHRHPRWEAIENRKPREIAGVFIHRGDRTQSPYTPWLGAAVARGGSQMIAVTSVTDKADNAHCALCD